MATVTKPMLLDETGARIAAGIDKQNALIGALIKSKLTENEMSWSGIRYIVQNRLAPVFFDIGDTLWGTWSNGGTEYSVPWVVTHFEDVELQDGEVVPAMFLQSKYCFPDTIQFDNSEAIFAFPNGLAAGSYCFTVAQDTWVSTDVDKTFGFMLAQAVPAGGQLFIAYTYNATVEGKTWRTYASNSSTEEIESGTIAQTSEGTSLGSVNNSKQTDGNVHINSSQVAKLGYNRYMQSAVRQWINGETAAGAWWAPQHEFDRPPTQATTLAGLASGFEADFKAVLQPIKVQVAANTVTDGGATDIMYDKFFLPSLQQMYVTPQLAGVEGVYWEYWKRAMGRTTPIGTGSSNTNDALIHHILNADGTPGSAASAWWRSAYRGHAYSAWFAYSAGYATNTNANLACRAAPACAIC